MPSVSCSRPLKSASAPASTFINELFPDPGKPKCASSQIVLKASQNALINELLPDLGKPKCTLSNLKKIVQAAVSRILDQATDTEAHRSVLLSVYRCVLMIIRPSFSLPTCHDETDLSIRLILSIPESCRSFNQGSGLTGVRVTSQRVPSARNIKSGVGSWSLPLFPRMPILAPRYIPRLMSFRICFPLGVTFDTLLRLKMIVRVSSA
jgi:hypothetical protein